MNLTFVDLGQIPDATNDGVRHFVLDPDETDGADPKTLILIENLNNIMDELRMDWDDFRTRHSGIVSLVEKAKGGPDIEPFLARARALRARVMTAQIPPGARDHLLLRIRAFEGGLRIDDWWWFILGLGGYLLIDRLLQRAGW